ncbi:MAG: M23 family metallopeptidase [Chloroflexota bacterium]
MPHRRIDLTAVVAFLFLFFLVSNALKDQGVSLPSLVAPSQDTAARAAAISIQGAVPAGAAGGQSPALGGALEADPGDPNAIAAPYEHYTLTQGLHGFDYGHMAIDIAAGKGALILSPINGIVSALYIDEWGNTTLVIENDRYQVMMLHGLYEVGAGERVVLGQVVGKESNQGNTVDGLGRSCRGRDCGYHTHLNIFDKQLGANVNPLELLGN